MTDDRTFPVLGSQPAARVPWLFIETHARQVYRNHGQTLQRLAERGGLSWGEIRLAIEGRRLTFERDPDAESVVRAALAAWSRGREAAAARLFGIDMASGSDRHAVHALPHRKEQC